MNSFFQFLKRNRLYTFIEAFGLAIAIGFIILLASYANTEYNVGNKLANSEHDHPDFSQLFRSITTQKEVQKG